MAKESKQDRLVRQVFDQFSEHMHDLKSLQANPNSKEMEVERWAQSFLKGCLGYSATNGYNIRPQESKGKMRPDLIVYKDQTPIFVVEIKKLGFDLNKSDLRSGVIQLEEYLFSIGKVNYGMLSNGFEWKLYDFSNTQGVVEICSYDLRDDNEQLNVGKKAVEDLCYDFLDIHEDTFSNNQWAEFAKEATAFSPESLTKAILTSSVIKLISKEIKGEHDYKVNLEVLFDKVYDVLYKGLNDTIKDLNEVKVAEFQKYIKSQKRSCRKAKKTTKKSNEELPAATTKITEIAQATDITIQPSSPTEIKKVA